MFGRRFFVFAMPHPAHPRRHRTRRYHRLRAVTVWLTALQVASLVGALALGQPDLAWGNSNLNVSLEVTTPGSGTSESTAATPASSPGGGGPPWPISPDVRPNPFVAGEATVAPYIYVGMLDGTALSPGEPGATYRRTPAFRGKTSLADAIIYVELVSDTRQLFAIRANVGGVWEYMVPEPLEVGWHTLRLYAVSPYQPSLAAQSGFTFQVLPLPVIDSAEPPVASPPRPTTPLPQPPAGQLPPLVLPPSGGLYDVRVEVQAGSKVVSGRAGIQVRVRLTPLVPPAAGEAEVAAVFRIVDAAGHTVLRQEERLLLDAPTQVTRLLRGSLRLPPGDYRVELELITGDASFVTTDTFQVATSTLLQVPGLTVGRGSAASALLGLSAALALLVMGFLLALWREHHHSVGQPQVVEEDLVKDHDIR